MNKKEQRKRRKSMVTKLGKIGQDDDRVLDYRYWDKLGDEARFEATWELVKLAYEIKGVDLKELRFRKDVERLCRPPDLVDAGELTQKIKK